MSVAFARTGRRRLTALFQLLLFAFTTSTPLLPCAHAGAQGTPDAVTAHVHAGLPTTIQSAHHTAPHTVPHTAASPVATSDMASLHHAPPDTPTAPVSHGAACPWVVGCASMMQLALDESWSVGETVPPSTAPVGLTLRQVSTARDVELRPPRA